MPRLKMSIDDGYALDNSMAQESEMLPFDLDLDDLHAMSVVDHDPYASFSQAGMPALVRQNIRQSVEAESGIQPSLDYHDSSEGTPVGAGPLPHSYGLPPPPTAQGSTLTEFTKRRNWSQRVIEELRDFLYILSPDGRLLYVSPSVKDLTGFEVLEIVGKLIFDFVHPEDASVFVREFHESIASGNPLRFFYRFRKKDESYTIFESHGHPHLALEAASYGQNAGARFCRGFFMMARPYPTKNAALLDSFLEHKIENERLRKRIAELKREEQEDLETTQQILSARATTSESTQRSAQSATPTNYDGMPPPAKPTRSDNALTRQNLDEVLAASRPDSIKDKMARYEGATHMDPIQWFTGLRYREGELSNGISTGASSPTLIRGDAGIDILVDKEGRPMQGPHGLSSSPYREGLSSEKKKKMKVADEYVCTDCGTLDSPEWRRGPTGPKTLCNACGLRWAKKEKKRSGGEAPEGSNAGETSQGPSPEHPMQVTPTQFLSTTMPMDTSMNMQGPMPQPPI